MLTPNQYMRLFTSGKTEEELKDVDLVALRQKYIMQSDKMKKKLDRVYIKSKNSVTFDEWMGIITYNISEGLKRHAEVSSKDKIIRVEWNEHSLNKFKLKSNRRKHQRNSR